MPMVASVARPKPAFTAIRVDSFNAVSPYISRGTRPTQR